jgi:hypothetical protein
MNAVNKSRIGYDKSHSIYQNIKVKVYQQFALYDHTDYISANNHMPWPFTSG